MAGITGTGITETEDKEKTNPDQSKEHRAKGVPFFAAMEIRYGAIIELSFQNMPVQQSINMQYSYLK